MFFFIHIDEIYIYSTFAGPQMISYIHIGEEKNGQ
jgi:hypothetical protein